MQIGAARTRVLQLLAHAGRATAADQSPHTRFSAAGAAVARRSQARATGRAQVGLEVPAADAARREEHRQDRIGYRGTTPAAQAPERRKARPRAAGGSRLSQASLHCRSHPHAARRPPRQGRSRPRPASPGVRGRGPRGPGPDSAAVADDRRTLEDHVVGQHALAAHHHRRFYAHRIGDGRTAHRSILPAAPPSPGSRLLLPRKGRRRCRECTRPDCPRRSSRHGSPTYGRGCARRKS